MKKLLMIVSVLLIIVKLISSSTNINNYSILDSYINGPKKELFKTYHFLYEKEKEYQLYSEEGIRRYNNFKENLKKINEENAKNQGYILGLGPFSDMSHEEFRQKMLMKPEYLEELFSETENKSKQFLERPSVNYTPNTVKINWEWTLGVAKNQLTCGCCWAFASTTAVEANFNRQFGGSKFVLSPQHLVDCDTVDNGCHGGNPSSAYQYMATNGVKFETDYPYKNAEETCHFKNDGWRIVSGYDDCPKGSCPIDKWLASLSQGPVTVGVDADSLQNYRGGIIRTTSTLCDSPNHAVLAYAWDFDPIGNADFVRIRNSWGPKWGENGGSFSMYYEETNNTCFMTRRATRPLVQEAPLP